MIHSHILWDFNGTILNDVEVGFESANILLTRHGLNELKSIEEYRKIFCFPIIDYYRKLGFDFNKNPYSELAVEWVSIYNENVYKAKLYDGIIRLLNEINKSKSPQLILSATELKMLKGQLKSLGISEYFDMVLGTGDIYAYSKEEIAINWANIVKPKNALLIGDTTHDKTVADAAGFNCILVANGHEDKQRLIETNATVVDSVNDIIHLL
ncbi:MAG: HAD family hydrolase [Ruminococcaceae bacterium]|nr:HAD family hydrolase [Oscillospiraceae bacterium]